MKKKKNIRKHSPSRTELLNDGYYDGRYKTRFIKNKKKEIEKEKCKTFKQNKTE